MVNYWDIFKKYTPSGKRHSSYNKFTEKLYDYTVDWLTSGVTEEKNRTYNALKALPGTSHWLNYVEGSLENYNYLIENGLTWSDIKRLDKMPGNSKISGAYAGVVNYTSSNIKKLYR